MKFSFFDKKNKQKETIEEQFVKSSSNAIKSDAGDILVIENIKVGQKSVTKDEAIEMVGQLLVKSGYAMPEYIEAMKEREKMLSTYIGEGIAIPHGIGAAKDKIIKTGISVIQFPEGVMFDEEKKAFLVIGIAGKGNEHMKILSNLAEIIQEGDVIKELFTTKDTAKIYNIFTNKL